jgi:hypothetical protein
MRIPVRWDYRAAVDQPQPHRPVTSSK